MEKAGQSGVGAFLGMSFWGSKDSRQRSWGWLELHVYRMKAKIWKHPSAGLSWSCDPLSLPVSQGPSAPTMLQGLWKAEPISPETVISGRDHKAHPSFLPPSIPITQAQGSGSTWEDTHLAPIPDETRTSRNGTRCSYRHVGPGAHEGVGHGVDELPADPKVTELDLSTAVH